MRLCPNCLKNKPTALKEVTHNRASKRQATQADLQAGTRLETQMLAGPGGWHEAQVAPADPARVTLVSARDLAGGQPVSEGRRKLCHGGFVDGAGDGIVYEVT